MDVLKQAYPDASEEYLESVLVDADLDVIVALELLTLYNGTPDDDEDRNTDSSSENGNFSDDSDLYGTLPELSEQNPVAVQAESSKDDYSPLSTWIAMRVLFPQVTFDYVRRQYVEWEGPLPDNFTMIIAQRLKDTTVDSGNDVSEQAEVPVPEGPVECGCCFTEFEREKTTHCGNQTSPHSFCMDCAKRYAETEIGGGRTLLTCIDQSGCKELFLEGEIQRFLDDKTYEGYWKLRMQNDLNEANLDGLVRCPFCDFAAIMEDPTDRIFDCQNCYTSSCRDCRVKSHHPMSCEQFQKEKVVDAKHVVEEAMTAALVKACSKCKKPFLKESGCNKMLCACGNSQCYICSAKVEGYTHFGNGAGQCPLYDNTAERERKKVAVAQMEAILDLLSTRNDVKENDLTVDQSLVADTQEQGGQRERIDQGRQIQFGRGPGQEMLGREQVEGEIPEEIDWEMQEDQEAIAAIIEFERMEQIRLDEEARAANERERQEQQRKKKERVPSYIPHPFVENESAQNAYQQKELKCIGEPKF